MHKIIVVRVVTAPCSEVDVPSTLVCNLHVYRNELGGNEVRMTSMVAERGMQWANISASASLSCCMMA